jgi:CDP-4-dehydro-6-deoxyglucose reductase, E1
MKLNQLKKQIKKSFDLSKKINKNYPLLDDAFSFEDLMKGIEIILSKKITMGEVTYNFEKEFAKFLNVKYALMTNSGSSANLLASFALVNPKKRNFLKRGDEFIIQALCWSTSLWPLVQAGLKPKFIDVNIDSFNIDLENLKKHISSKTKALMAVHVLGNSSEIDLISKLCKQKKIYLIEDTCESLGSRYNNKYLGTFGDFGTYSFYYSHQITCGEGGMLVCNSKEDYNIVHSLRSHGWDRGIANNKKKLPTFNFINSGFNLRPTDIAAAIGLNQFKRLNHFKKIRSQNKEKIIKSLINSKKWNNQFTFFNQVKNLEPSWFGFPLIINNINSNKKNKFLSYLRENGIETRPIISGNFMNQKSIDLYKLNEKKQNFKNAQKIEDTGFFIGLHTQPIEDKKLKKVVHYLLMIDNF